MYGQRPLRNQEPLVDELGDVILRRRPWVLNLVALIFCDFPQHPGLGDATAAGADREAPGREVCRHRHSRPMGHDAGVVRRGPGVSELQLDGQV